MGGEKLKKTHDKFLEELKTKNIKIYNELSFLEEYNGANKRILAKNKFGEILVTPVNLLNGHVPDINSAVNKTNYFINQLIYIHGNKYNYNLVEYKKSKEKITIIDKYGELITTPAELLNGATPKTTSAKNPNQYFANKCKDVHGDKYDYSLVDYKNYKTKVTIICKIHGEFQQEPGNHLIGRGCPYCYNTTLQGHTDVATTNPELISYFKDKTDASIYSKGSSKYVDLKCVDCGYEKSMRVNTFVRYGFSCNKCSDGVSIPEKFMFGVLTAMNIKFTPQYSPNWAMGKRYDFYVNNGNMIIETHGLQHYNENNVFKMTLQQQKHNDDTKYKLAMRNGVENYISIDCRNSDFIFLKNNFEKSFHGILDTSGLDLLLIYKNSMRSKLVLVCKLYNEHKMSVTNIANMVAINNKTVRDYLHKGTVIGLCRYDGEIENLRIKSKITIQYDLFMNEIARYPSAKIAYLNSGATTSHSSICKCCRGEMTESGGFIWKYE